jgi:hypothetical protein
VTCTVESFTPRRAWIAGTLGTIEIDPTFYAPSRFTLRRFGERGAPDGAAETFEPDGDALAGPGKGLRFEAAEVARCLAAGLTESPGMPLDETVAVMATMDEIRRRIGLRYGADDGAWQ